MTSPFRKTKTIAAKLAPFRKRKTPAQSAEEAWKLLRAHERAWEKKEQAFVSANTKLQHELDLSRAVNKELSKSYDMLKADLNQWREEARTANQRADGFDEQIVAASDRYVKLTDAFMAVLHAYEGLIAKVLKAEDANKKASRLIGEANAAQKAAEAACNKGDEIAQEMCKAAKEAATLLADVVKRVNLIRPMPPTSGVKTELVGPAYVSLDESDMRKGTTP